MLHPTLIPLLATLVLLAPALHAAPSGTVADAVEQILQRKSLGGAAVSVAISDADSGERLFSRDIDSPRVPASNLKLLTTAAAITQLGPDYHFVTRLLSTSRPDREGVLPGDLVLVGGGDPCLREDALAEQGVRDPSMLIAELLRSRGVTRIDGALVLDDGFLDREWISPQWEPGDLDFDYAAPVSALSLHGNALEISLDGRAGGSAPLARVLTEAEGYTLRNEIKWSGKKRTFVVGALRPDDGGVVRLTGRMSRDVEERSIRVPVLDGALLFGRCLRTQLTALGIPLRGGVQREAGAARSLADAAELVRFESPLALAVVLANKESDNSISDHLFKVMGAELFQDGSFEGGARAVERFLRDVVQTRTDGLVLHDGSGLARANTITARQMVDTLVAMNTAPPPVRDLFLRTLPVSGLDGSLKDRLVQPPYLGAVRAKTGYIRGVSSLSGYVRAESGRILAFSILINDVPAESSNRLMKDIQDDICRDLVERW